MTYAELERLAINKLREMRGKGESPNPVVASSRRLASNFWGSAWMKQLSLCEEGGLSLSPGRSLLRHFCVLDLRISIGRIDAKVMGEYVYDVSIGIPPLEESILETLRRTCSSRVSSLVALLEGKLDADLLSLLCDPTHGLLPQPEEWRMSCTCPDWSEPCLHEAAAIYAGGILIDENPSLLFHLRQIKPEELLQIEAFPPSQEELDTQQLGKIFGIELSGN